MNHFAAAPASKKCHRRITSSEKSDVLITGATSPSRVGDSGSSIILSQPLHSKKFSLQDVIVFSIGAIGIYAMKQAGDLACEPNGASPDCGALIRCLLTTYSPPIAAIASDRLRPQTTTDPSSHCHRPPPSFPPSRVPLGGRQGSSRRRAVDCIPQ